jgi:putative ABC transport system permease protein
MSLWRQVTRGLRTLANGSAADRDVSDAVADYLEHATQALVASGLRPEEARRAARRELGSTLAIREQIRASGWEHAVDVLVADVRCGLRRLRSNPGFAIVSVLTLALGIGASTAIFSAVNPVLFEPLPYPQAGRIMMIWDAGRNESRLDVTFGTYRELVERSRTFENVAVWKAWQPTVTGPNEPERLVGQRVTAAYFRVLGVSPAIGREFMPSEDRSNGPAVAILSDRLWRRRFGADQTIVGRQIALDDRNVVVVGVMPPGFENVLSAAAEIWAPLQYDSSLPPQGREWGHHLRMAGRLRPDANLDRARRELNEIAQSPVPSFVRAPWAALPHGFIVTSLQDDITQGVKPALVSVMGAVLVLLAIACVNVTNLLLARGAQRRGEITMRAALGAGRARIVRQLLTESVLLAGLGGAVGIVLANLCIDLLVALSPAELPRRTAIGLDGTVLGFAIGVTTLVGLIVGIVPALQASRVDLTQRLQGNSRVAHGDHRTRRILVVAEVALALTLLISAGLLSRSLHRLLSVDPGFDAAHLLTMQIQTSGRRFDDDEFSRRFFAQVLDAVRQVPGVARAALSSQLPLSGDFDQYGVRFESLQNSRPEEDRSALVYAVTAGYFEAMRIPLRQGRLLDEHDVAGKPVAVVISESLAKRRFPEQDPIGQRVHVGSADQPWYSVVGVVADVKQASLAASQPDAAYVTTDQWYVANPALWLMVRSRGDAAALAHDLKNAIWSIDKDQPIVRVVTMEELVAMSEAERRFALVLFEAFGFAALILAATGIFGVLSGSVTERTREIGVRSALGASRFDILGLVVRQGMTLTGVGLALGLVGAMPASRALVTLLYGISPLDPLTYAGVMAMLLVVSIVACGVPAWRAARVDPSITLRAE